MDAMARECHARTTGRVCPLEAAGLALVACIQSLFHQSMSQVHSCDNKPDRTETRFRVEQAMGTTYSAFGLPSVG